MSLNYKPFHQPLHHQEMGLKLALQNHSSLLSVLIVPVLLELCVVPASAACI